MNRYTHTTFGIEKDGDGEFVKFDDHVEACETAARLAVERTKASARVCSECDGTGKSSEYSRTMEGYLNCNKCSGKGVVFEEQT